MKADLKAIQETVQGTLVGAEELSHDSVDVAFVSSDPNEVSDDYTNILLVTNLVHVQLMKVAEDVDIVAIVFTNGHMPKQKEIARAKEMDIDLIVTPKTLEDVQKLLKKNFSDELEVRGKAQLA